MKNLKITDLKKIIKTGKEKAKQSQVKSLDSLSVIKTEIYEALTLHGKIHSLNKIILNLLIISVISLSLFLLLISGALINQIFKTKDVFIEHAESGLENITNGFASLAKMDTENAKNYFEKSRQDLNRAKKELGKIKPITASVSLVPFIPKYQKTANELLKIENEIIEIGFLATTISENRNLPKEQYQEMVDDNFKEIENGFNEIEKSLFKVDTRVFSTNQNLKISALKELLPSLKNYLPQTKGLIKNLPEMLGFYNSSNYLLLFENNNELRGSGGFIGSFGILTLDKGEIKNFFIEDVYRLDNPYRKAIQEGKTPYIKVPYPMDPGSTGNWSFRDSNLNPDFEESAKTALSFYQTQRIFSNKDKYPEDIKGVFALTTSFFDNVIEILGPVPLPEYNLTLNGRNTLETLSLEVEAGQDKQNNQNPKTILSKVGDFLFKKMEDLTKEEISGLALSTVKNLDQKHIMLYFENEKIQKVSEDFNWSGKMTSPEKNKDYLMIVNNNFGGGKSSLQIEELIKQRIIIRQDGAIEKEITITRNHTSDYKFKYYDPWAKKDMWLIGDNNNYIKVYVPEGSKFIKASGFNKTVDILSENKRTVYGGWFSVSPKQTKQITINYELPFKINEGYHLNVQKQPGTLDSYLETSIESRAGFAPKKIITNLASDKLFFSGYLDKDRYLFIK